MSDVVASLAEGLLRDLAQTDGDFSAFVDVDDESFRHTRNLLRMTSLDDDDLGLFLSELFQEEEHQQLDARELDDGVAGNTANEDTKETSGEIGSENFSRQNETRSSKRLETLNVHEQPVAEKVATKKRTRTSSGEEVVLEGHKVDGKTTDCKCTWCTKGMAIRGRANELTAVMLDRFPGKLTKDEIDDLVAQLAEAEPTLVSSSVKVTSASFYLRSARAAAPAARKKEAAKAGGLRRGRAAVTMRFDVAVGGFVASFYSKGNGGGARGAAGFAMVGARKE